ncbi:rCG27679, isoform CRA_a [Rattus norvegicus]|uniref:RCG27679, isoform CRA_a n=1 Tax=Rattus norvegicus TaxID=10116 RepID=A6KBV1_RAT|nr:rCG27679, isoform CRA_a [Rattus norvegicus]
MGGRGCWTDLSPSYSPPPCSSSRWLSAPASILRWLLVPVADSVCSAWSGAGPVLWPGQICHRSPGGPLGSAPRPDLTLVACGPCLLALPPAALTSG